MDFVDPIKEFFKDEEIFLTGGTGLMGKVLVEKLLRSCIGIKRIFVLIRDKKNCSESRLESFKQSRVFERLRKGNATVLDKICAVSGDISLIGLGIGENDMKLMENVSIIFHVAATIRFDESLKNAIILNVRGTKETLLLAKKLKKLKMFLHVSTTFSNPYVSHVKEQIYPPFANWKSVIKMAEILDEDTLNALTNKFLGKFPNTYTLTKHLGEHVVNDYGKSIPVVVYRPSIITNALKEPFPGWFDAILGPVGILIGAGTGLIRILYCDPDMILDVSPLDEATKTMIVTMWNDYNLPRIKDNENVRVYNSSSNKVCSYTTSQLIQSGLNNIEAVAFDKTLWYPRLSFTKNKWNYIIQLYLFHVLPAIFLDALLKILGKDPFILKLHRKVLSTQEAVKFFMFRNYSFENNRLRTLMEEIKNYEDFRYDTMMNRTLSEYSIITLRGGRRYILKEDDRTILKAQSRFKILKYVDFIFRHLFFLLILRMIYHQIRKYLHFD